MDHENSKALQARPDLYMKPTRTMPRLLIVGGKTVNPDAEPTPVGVYDVIRTHLRRESPVQPLDRIAVERVKTGYRGVACSGNESFVFVYDSQGLAMKRIDATETATMRYVADLQEREAAATQVQAQQRDAVQQAAFNEEMEGPILRPVVDATTTATPEDGPVETLVMHGPVVDAVERVPNRRIMINTQMPAEPMSAGGVVVRKDGKVLIVKPANGHGGYDWTFPKGHLEHHESVRYQDGGAERAAEREVFEETGYSCKVIGFISDVRHDDGGRCLYYEMRPLSDEPEGTPDGEIAESKWVTTLEAMELLNDDKDVALLSVAHKNCPRLVLKAIRDKSYDLAKASIHEGVMVAFFVPNAPALHYSQGADDAELADDLHVTLAYLGKGLSAETVQRARMVVREIAAEYPDIEGIFGGIGRFTSSPSSEGRDVLYASVDSPKLSMLRTDLVRRLRQAQVPVDTTHGYTPHMTLRYIHNQDTTQLPPMAPVPFRFRRITLASGSVRESFEMSDFRKALPRKTRADKEAESKKEVKPIKAASKKAGASGKTRYGYSDEKKTQTPKKPAQQKSKARMQLAPSPSKAEPDPIRVPDDDNDKHVPQHTVSTEALIQQLGISKDQLENIVQKYPDRERFIQVMSLKLGEFAKKYGLDDDYFGLVHDVVSGRVPPPSTDQPSKSAKA